MQAEDFIEPDAPAAKVVPSKVRPATLRNGIKSYHFWIVDLMLITSSQSDDDGKSSTAAAAFEAAASRDGRDDAA